MELICPVGSPAALRDAVDAGAPVVQCGFADETTRDSHFQNFSRDEMVAAIAYAHAGGAQVVIAVDSPMRGGIEKLWLRAVDSAVALGADAVLVSDIGLLAYVADKYPAQRRHLAMQLSSASSSHIGFLVQAFGIRRAVLPRGMLRDDVLQIAEHAPCEIEIIAGNGVQRQSGDAPAQWPSLDMPGHLCQLRASGVAAVRVEDAPVGSAAIHQLLADMNAAAPGEVRAA